MLQRTSLDAFKNKTDVPDDRYNPIFYKAHFQPIVNNDGLIVGVEVLARKKRENGGIINPDQFIPGLIRKKQTPDLDKQMLREACEFLNTLSTPSITASVNLSMRTICSKDIIEEIEKCLRTYGIPRSRIKLEVVEDAFPEAQETRVRAINTLKTLQQKGYKIVVDDYGVKASDIQRIEEITPDEIKIDPSLLFGHKPDQRYLEYLLRTDLRQQKPLIIEQVDTLDKRDKARQMIGTENIFFQGYLYATPGGKNKISKLINDQYDNRKSNLDEHPVIA
ncbi:MAG: EAL domain-containing protein [Alphaproteobacteria bacterium]|nr:EAL domain-containing protein [Alphaproteobacteria bacterium]